MDLPWAQKAEGQKKIELCIFLNSILHAHWLVYSLIVYADLMVTINSVIIMLNLGFKPQWGQEIFLFSKIIQTGSGAHQASYTMGTW